MKHTFNKLVMCFLLIAMLPLSACRQSSTNKSPAIGDVTPTAILLESENAGTICFTKPDSKTTLKGNFIFFDCFSGTCTGTSNQNITAVVDTNRLSIRFTAFAKVEVFDTQHDTPCVDACTPLQTSFKIENLEKGTYAIWLGDYQLGELKIPYEPISGADTCFKRAR
jgi:hypothetical protein